MGAFHDHNMELYRLPQLEDYNVSGYVVLGLYQTVNQTVSSFQGWNHQDIDQIVKKHKIETMIEVHHGIADDCTDINQYEAAVFHMYTYQDDAMEHMEWIKSAKNSEEL